MTLGRPEALWLLALAAPIVIAHLYRGRVRLLEVPALFLWEQVLPAEDLRSGLQRIRHLAGLLIALTALVLLTSVVADPTVRGITREPRRYVIVVDTSKEMTPDRLSAARDHARAIVERLARRDTAAIVDGSGVVQPPIEDRGRLDRSIERLTRTRTALEPRVLLEEAKAADPGASIVVLSCRPWPEGDFARVPIGTPKPNVALVDPRLTLEDGRHVARGVAVNLSDAAREVRFEVWNRGRVLRSEALPLGPRERKEVLFVTDPAAFPLDRFAEGVWLELRLKTDDARPEDDAAGFVIPATKPVRVVLVSAADPDPHLLMALEVQEQARTVTIEPVRAAAFESARSRFGKDAVYVFDRVPPPKPLSDGGYLIIGGEGPAARARAVEGVKVVDWDRSAVVNRWVDYSDVKVGRATVLKGDALVTSDRGPLAVWSRRQGLAWIQFGFSFGVENGDFALTPSFPVFLRHAIAWLAEDGRRSFPRAARAGEMIVNSAPLADPDAELKVSEVRGGSVTDGSALAPNGEVRIPVEQPGLVKIVAGSQEEWVGVTAAEPVDLSTLPAASGRDLPARVPWWRDLPWYIVAAAIGLALLALEWVLYQRGIV